MKKFTLVLLCLCMTLSAFTAFADETWEHIYVDVNDVFVTVDGAYVQARNFVHEGTTYLSLRDMGTALGYEVGWDGETKTASLTATQEEKTVKAEQGEKSSEEISVLVNDVNVVIDGKKIDVRNFVYQDTTYLSLRDIGNAVGYDVYWDEPSKTAVLTSPGNERIIPSELTLKDILTATVDGVEIPQIYLEDCYSYAVQMVSEDQIAAFLDYQAYYYAYVIRECERLGITVDETETKDVEQAFSDFVSQYGGKEAFVTVLEQNGYTYDGYKEQFMLVQSAEALFGKLDAYIAENNSEIQNIMTEAEAKYEEEKAQYTTDAVTVKHILIPVDENTTRESAKIKANNILNKLESGERFDKLLSQNNNDPGQPDSGYEVYAGSGFVAEFEEAALKLKKGEISPLVESDYGFHIIKALDNYKKEITLDEYVSQYSEFGEKISEVYQKLLSTWIENVEADFGWYM